MLPLLPLICDLLWVIFLPWVHSHESEFEYHGNMGYRSLGINPFKSTSGGPYHLQEKCAYM